VIVLAGEIRYYRGVNKVRVMTESEGYLIVEALEEFRDTVDGEIVTVRPGEQRIVPPNLIFKEKSLPSVIKEHTYELQMEKKLKKIIAEEDDKSQ
jgi:mannose-6-phosphate isomerase-like protein (cupin superfamily)